MFINILHAQTQLNLKTTLEIRDYEHFYSASKKTDTERYQYQNL